MPDTGMPHDKPAALTVEQAGAAIAQKVVAVLGVSLRAAEDGWRHGYAAREYQATSTPVPAWCAVMPPEYAVHVAWTETYRLSFKDGQEEYALHNSDRP
jgi:hypothetical protein